MRTATNNSKGTSISERDPKIDFREEYGHWEMDTVVGKQGTKEVLLVLTERMTEQEIIRKIKSRSQFCVVNELDKIERKMGSKKFRETFINRYYEEIQLYPYQKTELLRLLDELNISGDDVRKSLSASFERAQDTGIMSVKEAADFIILELSGDVDQSRELAYKLAKKAFKNI